MADLFLSYAREDRDCARALAKLLEGQGWTVWWDHNLLAGKPYAEVIDEQLSAAACVVVLWSRDSVKSEWVQNEAREGLKRHVLVPVAVTRDVTPPLEFRHLQVASLADSDEVIASIRAVAGGKAVSSEAPPARVSVKRWVVVGACAIIALLAIGGFVAWRRVHTSAWLETMKSAVGRISVGMVGRCNAFLLDGREDVAMMQSRCLETNRQLTMDLGVRKAGRHNTTVRVLRALHANVAEDQPAVIRISPVGPRFGRISVRTRRAELGETVLVLYFPSAGGSISVARCTVREVSQREFHYNCDHRFDTGSGAPVVAESDHLLVGVHRRREPGFGEATPIPVFDYARLGIR